VQAIDTVAFGIPSSGPPTVTGHVFNSSAANTVVLRSDQPGECELYLSLEHNAPCDTGVDGAVPVAGAIAGFNQDGYGERGVAASHTYSDPVRFAREIVRLDNDSIGNNDILAPERCQWKNQICPGGISRCSPGH